MLKSMVARTFWISCVHVISVFGKTNEEGYDRTHILFPFWGIFVVLLGRAVSKVVMWRMLVLRFFDDAFLEQFVETKVCSARGSADTVVNIKDTIYVF